MDETRGGGVDKCLTVLQVADKLGSSPQTVYKLLESGELHGINIGTRKRRDWRIDPADFTEFKKRGGVR